MATKTIRRASGARPATARGTTRTPAAAAASAVPPPEAATAGAADEARSTATTPALPRAAPASRPRRVRQSCRLTEGEYAQLTALKKRAARLGRPMKRGRLLRAGLQAMVCMPDDELFSLLDAMPVDA